MYYNSKCFTLISNIVYAIILSYSGPDSEVVFNFGARIKKHIVVIFLHFPWYSVREGESIKLIVIKN